MNLEKHCTIKSVIEVVLFVRCQNAISKMSFSSKSALKLTHIQIVIDFRNSHLFRNLFRLNLSQRGWSMLSYKKYTPNVGLEPTTVGLRVQRSTDWASRADCASLRRNSKSYQRGSESLRSTLHLHKRKSAHFMKCGSQTIYHKQFTKSTQP